MAIDKLIQEVRRINSTHFDPTSLYKYINKSHFFQLLVNLRWLYYKVIVFQPVLENGLISKVLQDFFRHISVCLRHGQISSKYIFKEK